MTDPTFFNQFLIWPFINLLIVFYKGFLALSIPGPLGFAIITMTAAIRGALYPLTRKQMESAQKMQALKPHIDKLSKKHKNDKRKLQEEQMKLYQQHGINPAAGCLPMLLQFPILIALYRVFYQLLTNGNLHETVDAINHVVYAPILHIETLDISFFGLNLAQKPSQWQEHGWWLLLIPVITAGLQWLQTRQMMSQQAPQPQTIKKEKKEGENMSQELQKQMSMIMPIMIGFFAYQFPIGLALYWNTFTVLMFYHTRTKPLAITVPPVSDNDEDSQQEHKEKKGSKTRRSKRS